MEGPLALRAHCPGVGALSETVELNASCRRTPNARKLRDLGDVTPVHAYEPGTWGPAEAARIIGAPGWRPFWKAIRSRSFGYFFAGLSKVTIGPEPPVVSTKR